MGSVPSKESGPGQPPTIHEDKKRNALITAAIDFGTTYSGYAFSFKANPTEVFTVNWEGTNVKTKTVVLLDSEGNPVAFGKEAESKYLTLQLAKNTAGYYCFEKFKMQLYVRTEVEKKELNRDMEIEDMEGNSMQAIKVFSGALKYLINHLLDHVNQRMENLTVTSSDIHWVLTVPAIWNDGSRQFMREAAEMAGIPSDLLTLALEPESAAFYCFVRANQHFVGLNPTLTVPLVTVPSTESIKYILLDLGGGTADIACHELTHDGLLKELHEPTGGDFGGISVDGAFWQFLISLFGNSFLTNFKKQHHEEFIELFKNFDRKKCKFDDSREEVNFQISPVLCQSYKAVNGLELSQCLLESPKGHLVAIRKDKIVLKSELIKTFFEKSISQMKLYIETLYDSLRDTRITHLVMVGGFSESKYVQKVFKEYFGGKLYVIIPENPTAAVVIGAVYFGQNPSIISKRVCRYTYGIARMSRFKEGLHPETKLRIINNAAFIDDIFNIHIRRGEVVNVDADTFFLSYYPPLDYVRQVVLPVYASTEPNPRFVTEKGCKQVGIVTAELSEFAKSDDMELLVKLIFRGTEIGVELLEAETKRIVRGKVEFWG